MCCFVLSQAMSALLLKLVSKNTGTGSTRQSTMPLPVFPFTSALHSAQSVSVVSSSIVLARSALSLLSPFSHYGFGTLQTWPESLLVDTYQRFHCRCLQASLTLFHMPKHATLLLPVHMGIVTCSPPCLSPFALESASNRYHMNISSHCAR